MKFQEAEVKLNELIKEGPDWWCPITQKQCRKDCFCYQPPKIKEDPFDRRDIIIKITKASCNHKDLKKS